MDSSFPLVLGWFSELKKKIAVLKIIPKDNIIELEISVSIVRYFLLGFAMLSTEQTVCWISTPWFASDNFISVSLNH